ncbi:hypothetical protein CAMGR0001_0686 [Campylobacter gracilis RM3268]|uniref:Uncharacterized protein n=1 Tax=Campylobacter gracilis RM3268 TaxID=553220 RepID=C8PFP3_9BACT|nr:hypothetical protein CAMGR0001_0686 [Campylobacter gracilis RM3268]
MRYRLSVNHTMRYQCGIGGAVYADFRRDVAKFLQVALAV